MLASDLRHGINLTSSGENGQDRFELARESLFLEEKFRQLPDAWLSTLALVAGFANLGYRIRSRQKIELNPVYGRPTHV